MGRELERERKQSKLESEEHEVSQAKLRDKLYRYQHENHMLKAKVGRIPSRLGTAVKRIAHTYNMKADKKQKFFMKHDGVVTDETRNIFLDLVAIEEVPANRVTHVFKRIAGAFGIEVEGDVSRRTVGRIAKEGGVASKLQIGKAVLGTSTKGMHKNIRV